MLASAHAVANEPSAAQYRDGYEQYLTRWLDVYRISGNPIDETELGQWLLAYQTSGPALTIQTRQRMQSFACRLAERYLQRGPRNKASSTNNWQSHRVKLAVMGALVCAKPGLIDGAKRLFEEQVQQNLTATGQSIDFVQRDALHYVVYSLEPLVEAALFASFYGVSLYDYTAPPGQSIGRSLQWLLPYATGASTHEEFVNSTVPFDKARAADGVDGFSGLFKPEKAAHLYWLASQLDAHWAQTSRALGTRPIAGRAGWFVR